MLRISLIIAIVAGVAALTVSQLKVAKNIEELRTNLKSTQDSLTQSQAAETKAKREARDATAEKDKAKKEKLSAWLTFGHSIEEIRSLIAENKKLVGDNDALKGENKMLGLKVTQIQSELDILQGTKTKVELPPSLKGKVIAVDPKYEFVVLDIGADDGLLARGEMLVNRSGKLVARVRILSLGPHRSVANVLPEWKQGEIMEGDIVLVGL